MALFGKWLLKHTAAEFADQQARLDALEERVARAEMRTAQNNMVILETADLVSYRLSQRERKRVKEPAPQQEAGTPSSADSRFLGASRRFGQG